MRISDVELKKVVDSSGYALVESESGFETSPREGDEPMIKQLIQDVIAMPDREEMIASLKERIAKGEYRPDADEIADVMYRRSIADKIR